MDAIEHVIELIPAYVLGSLDDDESFQVYQHIANCSICQKEWRAYESITVQLISAVPEVAPPNGLRTRLLQSVDHSFAPRQALVQEFDQERFTWQTFLQWLRVWKMPVWAGVSLILVLVVSNVFLWQQIGSLQTKITDTNMIVHPLHGSGNASETFPTGLVVMDPHGDYGTIIVDAVPPSGDGQQYQVWLSRGEIIESGGVFAVHANGYGAQVIYAPEPLFVYNRVWVTIEPTGGSEQPTGAVVLQTDP